MEQRSAREMRPFRNTLASAMTGIIVVAGWCGADAASAAVVALTANGQQIALFGEIETITSVARVARKSDSGVKVDDPPCTVVLRRGLDRNLQLSAWQDAVVQQGVVAKRNVTVVLFSPEAAPIASWSLQGAWPSKLDIVQAAPGSSQTILESVTLNCDVIQRLAV